MQTMRNSEKFWAPIVHEKTENDKYQILEEEQKTDEGISDPIVLLHERKIHKKSIFNMV